MSLKEDIVKWFDGTTKWPGDLEDEVDCVLLDDEIIDTSRWAVIHEAVYLRKTVANRMCDELTFTDEYVRVRYKEPATEYQDWGDEGPPEIEEVVPVEVTITKFEVKK